MATKKKVIPNKVVETPKEVNIEITQKDLDKVRINLKFKDNSIDDIGVAGIVEFLKPEERINFINELYRVLKPGCKARIIVPYWCSNRAYANISYEWPPVSEGWFFHLGKQWRTENNPEEKRYTCDFDVTLGYNMHPLIRGRVQEVQQESLMFKKEAAQDLFATLIKK